MMERALAHIEKVEWKRPIEGADSIELIGILGWVCIAKIDEFDVGDKCVYIEIDSLAPKSDERFAFLESKKYKIKTMKLNKFNVISQGLALPISSFPEIADNDIGTDVTKELKITYYSEDDRKRKTNKPNPDAKYKSMCSRHPNLAKKKWWRWMMKRKWGKKLLFIFFGKKKDKPLAFPDWIKKTDEERIENLPWLLESKEKWIVSEKLDGTSCTYAINKTKKNNYEFIVCSRNVRQLDRDQDTYHFEGHKPESNIYWELADKYDIKHKLTEFAKKNGYDRVVLQGEGVGSVQGNPYKLAENRLYCFNLVINGNRIGTIELKKWCDKNNMQCVPIVDAEHELSHDMESMKLEADGFSIINPKVKREGFVYRLPDGSQSFKNVSREYLLHKRD